MKAITMLDTIRSQLGVPACAIPLSVCRISKGYLLERAGIPPTGTAILFAIPYVMTADISNPDRNLSLYAVPRDYHGYAAELGNTLLPDLRDTYPAYTFALFSDHSPILEADAAARSGLGVLGDFGLLITPDYGSFVFLFEIVTSADYTAVTGNSVPTFPASPPSCERCGACARACPAGCRDGDRTACLSALTQKKGELTPSEIRAILRGGLVWGCDACQLACPHNRAVLAAEKDTAVPYFRENRQIRLDTAALEAMTDQEFSARAYAWRGKNTIRRNLAIMEERGNDESYEERREP